MKLQHIIQPRAICQNVTTVRPEPLKDVACAYVQPLALDCI